jgi:glycine/D-amino acid oxidase-like deaminating enzyme
MGAAPDVVVVGAGMVGAACAYFAAQAGLRVTVVDRGSIAGGTTGAGEGNLLISDRLPGPELDLTLYSLGLWRDIGAEVGRDTIELEPKGGLVVAATPDGMSSLRDLADRQRPEGVEATDVDAADLSGYEPQIATGLAGGVYYPQDMQLQPMLAAAKLLAASGATVHCGAEVRAVERDAAGAVTAVVTGGGDRIATGALVNAAGVWGADVAALAGARLPVVPRRGFILVTEPLGSASAWSRGVPPAIRHKVYAAEYVSTVVNEDAGLQVSAVVESTRAGTVLIGASRERVGFDRSYSLPVLRRLAAQAVGLFPFLADVSVLRTYRGFRPYAPDHLPVIGPDPGVPGLYHACGHEGAGIGLAPATGALIAAQLTGEKRAVDPYPFRPERFG